jgi:iron-sulfur cluster assembly protein/iron-sulfur cluster insertion protein
MSTFTVTDATQVFSMTDAAAAKVRELIKAEDTDGELVLRVAVRPGGCSGFSYEMFFDTEIAPDDAQTENGGVKVVIDPASHQMLKGATLDYKDALQGAGFSINNPNAERSCGCGQSFS